MDAPHKAYDAEQKIWSGPAYKSAYDVNTTIGRIVYDTLKAYSDKVCQVHEGGMVLTNSEVLTNAIRLAESFKKLGLTHKDVIGITAKNSKYVISLCIASFLNCSPYHGVHGSLDIGKLFSITKPKLLFCDGANYSNVVKATKGINATIYTITDHQAGVPSIEQLLQPTGTEHLYEPEAVTQGSHQTMLILTSSGTTGPPKPACVSNEMLVKQYCPEHSEEMILCFSSVDWVSGMLALLMFNCRRLMINRPFTPENFVDMVSTYKPTGTFITPLDAAALARSPLAVPDKFTSLLYVFLGGGVNSLKTINTLKQKMPTTHFSNAYASTEALHITVNEGMVHGTSTGKVEPGNKIRIVDEHERNLGPNEVGEVLLHNGMNWQGYYGDPEGTQLVRDAAGWIHTGDMGYFDDNEYLYLVGRKNEAITCYSLTFWPSEIQKVIYNIPGVMDCCVLGIPIAVGGHAPGALVIKEKDSQLSAEDIKEYVAKHFPETSKHLHAGVVFVESLPYNNNQKIIKYKAKEIFLAKLAALKN